MVVPVLMISCQVSEKPKIGPVRAQTIMISTAIEKLQAVPSAFEVLRATVAKASRTRQKRSRGFFLSADFDLVAIVLRNRLLRLGRAHANFR